MSTNATSSRSTTTTTATATTTRTTTNAVRRSSSILLVPAQDAKRRKLDDHTHTIPTLAGPSDSKDGSSSGSGSPPAQSPADIWRWTLTRDALAPCFVKDVFDMKDGGHRDLEYFWLGRVPCRTVELVGVVVGVQVYEQRIVYALDDGSAVMDCNHKLPPQPTSPRKPTASSSKAGRPALPYNARSGYFARTGSHPSSSKAPSTLPPPPTPVAEIGVPVRVIGRVVETAKGRHVLVDEIRPCASPNDEPAHWLAVLELHRTRYFAAHLGPFVVPPPKKRAPPSWVPRSPDKGKDKDKGEDKGKARAVDAPATPGKPRGVRDIEPSTPSTSGMASTDGSPASRASSSSRHGLKQTPIRLRHPTRLHRRDLTANTFRIYLKHYMDNAPPPADGDTHSAASSRAASPTPLGRSQPRAASLVTPRRPSRPPEGGEGEHGAADDRTPSAAQFRARLREIERGMAMATPRAGKAPARPCLPERERERTMDDDNDRERRYGFTLSHLRRVPELAILARRVVNEEGRRRAREERERVSAHQQASSAKAKAPLTSRASESHAKKMKRLFQFAIRQLYDEGSIVLWDGPVRPLPTPPLDPVTLNPLWKADASAASAMSSSTADGDDPGELSEPSPAEEAYLPLTPAVLADFVERAIREWIAAAAARKERHYQHLHGKRRADVDPSAPLAPLAPPPGPTPADIVAWLHRDARWARVGEWAVKDALEWGRAEERVWCIGQGRWELCG